MQKSLKHLRYPLPLWVLGEHQIELLLIEKSPLYWVLERTIILSVNKMNSWGFQSFPTNLLQSPCCIKHFLGTFQYFSLEAHGFWEDKITHINQRSRPDRGGEMIIGAVWKVIGSLLIILLPPMNPTKLHEDSGLVSFGPESGGVSTVPDT